VAACPAPWIPGSDKMVRGFLAAGAGRWCWRTLPRPLAPDGRAGKGWTPRPTAIDCGEYRNAGIGALSPASGVDLALIDDPVPEKADSAARRSRAWEWFYDDLRSRLRPGAATMVM
jgi:hypothetical protein